MRLVIFVAIYLIAQKVFAHPGGNMITVGDHVIWSYISPIDDAEHHACVMIWNPNSKPRILMKSEFPASDYMFYTNEKNIYIIEQRYLQQTDKFEIRVLKTTIGAKPSEIWGWFENKLRIGDGGFFMNSDDEIVFGRYPNIYTIKKGQSPQKYFEFEAPIKKIRAIGTDQILLLGESDCWLTDRIGRIIRTWNNLVDEQINNAPLNRNQIFDVTYNKGELLLAYWGKRSFDVIASNGIRKTISQLSDPLVPHWVAFYGSDKLLFSSKLIFSGETPKPNLILYKSEAEQIEIWKS